MVTLGLLAPSDVMVGDNGEPIPTADALRERFGDYLTSKQVAEAAGIRRGTWTSYVRREQVPPADQQYGRTKLWKPETVVEWLQRRQNRRRA